MESVILHLFQFHVILITLLMTSFEDIKQKVACHVYTGGNAVEINTEADSTDMTECPYDDKPSTSMFGFSDSKCTEPD